jgi:hypothetical protein
MQTLPAVAVTTASVSDSFLYLTFAVDL